VISSSLIIMLVYSHVISHQSPIINKWYLLLYLQSAVGWDYQAELSKHESQTDATKGFGGRYGVQKDRQDEVQGFR